MGFGGGHTIVVPCYNEADRLQRDQLCRLLRHDAVRLLLVDDGSTDQTLETLESLRESDPNRVTVLALKKNGGKAEAVRQGLLQAIDGNAEIVGFADADMATPCDELVKLVRYLEADPRLDGVLGSRVRLLGRDIRRSGVRHVLGRVFATCASLILKLPVYDTQCGAKFFRPSQCFREALLRPFSSRWAFDVELLLRLFDSAQSAGRTPCVMEVPLMCWRDVDGSKLGLCDMIDAALSLGRLAWSERLCRSLPGHDDDAYTI